MKPIRLIVCSGLLLVFACSSVQAGVINVPGDEPTIQDAIDVAINGDEVVVVPGTYPEAINFLGKAVTVRSASGDPSDTIIDGTGFFHVVQCVNGEDLNSVLEGFTIRRGEATGVFSPDDVGGGMYNFKSSPTVSNCIFTDNHAKISGGGPEGDGGGMYNDNSDPIVTDCTFELNSAEGHGGGMYNDNSNPTVTRCTFSVNSADLAKWNRSGGGMFNAYSSPTVTDSTFIGNSAANGGGMCNDHGDPIVTDCNFKLNTVDSGGGGMLNFNNVPTVTGCTFSGNSADDGGGMFNLTSNAMVTECIFSGNTANTNGGGMWNNSAAPTVTGCTFSGNLADFEGGGMYNFQYCRLRVTRCKFINNAAVNGGGMINRYGTDSIVTNCIFSRNWALDGNGAGMSNFDRCSPVVTNCTFSDNRIASNPAGGGGMSNEVSSSPTVSNTIFWGNVPEQVSYDPSSVRHITFCLVEGGSAGFGNKDADPLFVDAFADDLHLSAANSPAIDAGSNSLTGGGPLDLDGNNRFIDVPDAGIAPGPIVDMGAYEFGISHCLCDNGLVGDVNCDGVVDLADVNLLGAHWLETI